MTRVAALAIIVSAFACAPAAAQTWEAAALGGYTPSVALERNAIQVSEVDIAGGFTWGFQVARFFSAHWGAEVSWARQESALEVVTPSGTAELFSMSAAELHGNLVYRFGAADARVQPYLSGGLGATIFRADDIPTETKLSLGFGVGVDYFPWQSVGVRGQFRYKPTMLNDESAGDFCDPFGFCQDRLQQIELMAGVVLRF
jgi:opacity protein-like surface antigen